MHLVVKQLNPLPSLPYTVYWLNLCLKKKKTSNAVVQFYPWLKFYFPYSLGIAMYNNEFETKEIKFKWRIK